MPGTARKPNYAFTKRLQVAARKNHGELRSEAAPGESSSPGESPARWRIPGPERKRARFRQSWQRQDASFVRSRPGTDSQRTQDRLHYLRSAGTGSVASQEGTAAQPGHPEARELRGARD